MESVWLLVCICLMLFMQAGFACLEIGFVRSKNNVSVAMKNIADLAVSFLVYGISGYALMYTNVFVASGPDNAFFFNIPEEQYLLFMFNALFCSTAITIVSGAVAGRMAFSAYLSFVLIASVLIYPIVGQWTWGTPSSEGGALAWLADLGFYDFAGASVVHSVGGWMALTCIWVIGPRLGVFSGSGNNSESFSANAVAFSILGMLLIFIGWMGFNGGSFRQGMEDVPRIILVTIIGGVGGILSATLLSKLSSHQLNVGLIINGCLAGLVSITAGADLFSPNQALLIGFIGGMAPKLFQILFLKLKLDDVVGAVGVHLGAGIWGTFAILFALDERFERGFFSQLLVQAIGIVAIGVYVVLLSWLALKIIGLLMNYRVSAQEEIIGLNAAEFGISNTNSNTLTQLQKVIDSGELEDQLEVDPFCTDAEIATAYNELIKKFTETQNKNKEALEKATWMAERDLMTGMYNKVSFEKRASQEHARIKRYAGSATLAILDLDYFKSINDKYGHATGDEAIKQVARIIQKNVRATDLVGRLGGEEFAILLLETQLSTGHFVLEKIRLEIQNTTLRVSTHSFSLTASIGIVSMLEEETTKEALRRADIGLYTAKGAGRNNIQTMNEKSEVINRVSF